LYLIHSYVVVSNSYEGWALKSFQMTSAYNHII